MTTNRYLRLIAMALTEMIWSTSLAAYTLYLNVSPGLRPWTNWANVHSNFSRVGLFPTIELPPQFIEAMMLLWWNLPASGLIFFVFFAFGEEALKEYKKIWRRIMVKVFKRPVGGDKKGSSLFGGSFRSEFVFIFWFNASLFDWDVFISRLPRALHLVNLKSSTSSSSRDYKSASSPTSASHESYLSQSTTTLASQTLTTDLSYINKPITRFPQSKDDEATAYTQSLSSEPAPAYHTPYPSSYPEVYLASPTTDDPDTFTISTFSYYGGASSPSAASYRFDLTYPSSTSGLQGLSPPPVCPIVKRPIPRDVPSCAASVISEFPSRPPSPVLVPTVPQDVAESLPGMTTMNVPGGILVTVERQASVDEMVWRTSHLQIQYANMTTVSCFLRFRQHFAHQRTTLTCHRQLCTPTPVLPMKPPNVRQKKEHVPSVDPSTFYFWSVSVLVCLIYMWRLARSSHFKKLAIFISCTFSLSLIALSFSFRYTLLCLAFLLSFLYIEIYMYILYIHIAKEKAKQSRYRKILWEVERIIVLTLLSFAEWVRL